MSDQSLKSTRSPINGNADYNISLDVWKIPGYHLEVLQSYLQITVGFRIKVEINCLTTVDVRSSLTKHRHPRYHLGEVVFTDRRKNNSIFGISSGSDRWKRTSAGGAFRQAEGFKKASTCSRTHSRLPVIALLQVSNPIV